MKLVIASVIAILLAASAAYAKQSSYTGCTTDNKAVALKVVLDDKVPQQIENDIQKAFRAAASKLSATDLISIVGYKAFIAGLTQEDKDAILVIPGPPLVFGECK